MLTNPEHLRKAFYVTWIGVIVNTVLVCAKLLCGIMANSKALVADGAHSLSDFISDIVVLAGLKAASKPSDTTHNYGHGKFETLATVLVGILLIGVGGGILFAGMVKIIRVIDGEIIARPGWSALVVAGLSLIVKEWLYRYTSYIGRKIQSTSLIANAWHHRSDAFSSLGVFLGIFGATLLGRYWRILDPVAAVVVSVFILKVALEMAGKGLNDLLETSVGEETRSNIENVIRSVDGVCSLHQLRTRRIGGDIAMDVHILVNKTISIVAAHDISIHVEQAIREHFGAGTFISVHMEPDEK